MVIIVDPFSSGRFFAPAFAKKGVDCVAVLSSGQLPKFYTDSLCQSEFKAIIIFDGDFASLVGRLKTFVPVAVIAGSEPGVLLADRLGASLDLPHNALETSDARRDKYLMLETIRKKGISSPRQCLARSAKEAIDWVKSGTDFPCVVKPKDSAGTDGVRLCMTPSEVQSYFSEQLHRNTMLNTRIDAILVQEYLNGTEYVVDTVSSRGKHFVTAVWRYRKCFANGSPFVYDTMALVPILRAVEQDLVKYVRDALDALFIKEGPAHTEVMLTNRGPILIEVGARPHGDIGPIIGADCIGYGQIDYTVMAAIDPDSFFSGANLTYMAKETALLVFLINKKNGVFRGFRNLEVINNIPSLQSFQKRIHPGERIQKTVDLFTLPGRVVLIGQEDTLLREYIAIRDWEHNAYQVEDAEQEEAIRAAY